MILKLDTKEVTITNFYENLSENATLNASNNFLHHSELFLLAQRIIL